MGEPAGVARDRRNLSRIATSLSQRGRMQYAATAPGGNKDGSGRAGPSRAPASYCRAVYGEL